jgi:hypothetical protein
MIIQNDSTHNLIILNDSQLSIYNLTAELWGAEKALILANGKGMSEVKGLIISGLK